MTTIQDRIIKDFNNKFNELVGGEGSCGSWAGIKSKKDWEAKYNLGDIEKFLIKSIKEVEKETRKETLNEVNKYLYPENNWNNFIISKENWDKLLSITNKEKEK